MLLKLKNFRCHGVDEICEYTFDESGLVLLSGPSGSGKSSLLKAIIYALYGKVRKPYAFGTKTCSVTMEFMDMLIFRSSNPNRLIVNGLEDEPAQHFINERIGMNYTEFMLSSYVPQKNNSSLLSLSQAEQIEAIKMLAFKDDTSDQLHKKTKAIIKQLTESVSNTKAKVEFATSEVNTLSENLVQVSFPLRLGESETETECIQNYRERIKSFGSKISDLHSEQASLKDQLHELETAQDQINSLVEVRDELKEQIDVQSIVVDQLKLELAEFPIDLDQKISKLKQHLKCLEKRTALESMENSLKESIAAEISSREEKIAEIEAKLWVLDGEKTTMQQVMSTLQDTESTIAKIKEFNTKQEIYENAIGILEISATEFGDFGSVAITSLKSLLLEKVNGLTSEVDSLRNKKTEWAISEDRLKLERERIVCPNCDAGLRLQNGSLVCMDTEGSKHVAPEEIDYQSLISNATKKIRLLESEKKGIQTLYSKIETIGDIPDLANSEENDIAKLTKLASRLTKFIKVHTDMEQQQVKLTRELANENYGASVKNLQDSFSKETRIFEEMLENIDDALTSRDDLEAELASTQQLKTDRTVKLTEISEGEKLLRGLNDKYLAQVKKLIDLNHKLSGVNRSTILKKITKIEKQIERLKVKQDEDTAISEQVDQYLMYIERTEKLAVWNEKLARHTSDLADLESQLTGFIGLKTLIAKAEVKAENSVIETINAHTAYYLDMFFTEHKLTAIIETNPESKFTNLIDYKGNQYTSLSELSGGEFDRVTLASICGINSMLNSPILMLDESLASLDAETNTEIISFLKELSENKLILVCSHEAVTGIFDEIVSFNP